MGRIRRYPDRDYGGFKNPNYKGGKEYPCAQCGVAVYCAPSRLRRSKNVFCCSGCHDDFRRKPKPEKIPAIGAGHWRWSGPKYCPICGIELIGAENRRIKTCGLLKCVSGLKSRSRIGNKNPRWKDGKVHCKRCGIEITKRDRWTRTFCGRKCMGIWQSENLSGENSHAWKGGKRIGRNNEYPHEWTPRLRTSIRKRDGFICQVCRRNKPLDVHHIDKNKDNCDPSNLISLCRSCHRKVENKKEW